MISLDRNLINTLQDLQSNQCCQLIKANENRWCRFQTSRGLLVGLRKVNQYDRQFILGHERHTRKQEISFDLWKLGITIPSRSFILWYSYYKKIKAHVVRNYQILIVKKKKQA